MFTGSLTALYTPMNNDGSIDDGALRDLIEWQISEGTNGLIPVGTTGESATLTHAEHRRVVELTIEASAGRVPIVAGAGSNNTAEAIELALHAKECGADASLVVTPYYNKPSQEGMFLHFMTIADKVDLPLLVYNVPSRSAVDLTVETLARLARHPSIIGIKDSTGDLSRPLHTTQICGPDFIQLSGEDHTTVSFLAAGGHGSISVTANVAPALCAELHRAWSNGRVREAMAIQQRLLPLHDALFAETNPGPVNYAGSLLGRGAGRCRLPLAPPSASTQHRIRSAMVDAGLIN